MFVFNCLNSLCVCVQSCLSVSRVDPSDHLKLEWSIVCSAYRPFIAAPFLPRLPSLLTISVTLSCTWNHQECSLGGHFPLSRATIKKVSLQVVACIASCLLSLLILLQALDGTALSLGHRGGFGDLALN